MMVVMVASGLLDLGVGRLGIGEIPGLQRSTQGRESILLIAARRGLLRAARCSLLGTLGGGLLNLSVGRLSAGEIPGLQCATQGCEGILLAAPR